MKWFVFVLAAWAVISGEAGLASETTRGPAAARPGSKAVNLMSPHRERQFRKCLPEVNDPSVQAILDDERLILYTEAEMPRAHQDWDGALPGIHSAYYNISANRSEPFGNGNLEFPWGEPAGTHRARGVSSFRFLWLPLDKNGRTMPVVWMQQSFADDGAAGYSWLFPVGAVLGEVLMLRGPDRLDYTFEMRLRIREVGHWNVNVFRPFPRAKQLADRIKELRPGWAERPALAKAVAHLESPIQLASHTLADGHPSATVFRQRMGVDFLPSLEDDRLVAELLTTTTFRSAISDVWRQGANGERTFAPTTTAPFHIVPANYDAGFIEVDSASCARCHSTVGMHVRNFDYSRDWYGRIRGSDGIFSFHPFAPSSISSNGFGGGVALRRELIDAGVLQQYDARLHPRSLYHQAKLTP